MKDNMTPDIEEGTIVEDKQSKTISFGEALLAAADGKRISRKEWKDIRHYGLLVDTLLSIHKAGEATEKTHHWIVNDGDIVATDWFVLPEVN